MILLFLKVPVRMMKTSRKNLSSQEPNWNEVLCVTNNPKSVFNEMWFLTIDPFVGIPIFIAKLSERQYCWRVIEDFHCKEYIKFFTIHNCLFMRFALPPLAVMDYQRDYTTSSKYPFQLYSGPFC